MFSFGIRSLAKSSIQTNRLFSKVKGTVKFFDPTKGFGFITPEDGGADVFVHQTAIHAKGFRSLADGESVEYEIGDDQRTGKKVAVNVSGPNGEYVQGSPRRERDNGMNNSRI